MLTTSLVDVKYFMTFSDDFSKKVWVYMLKIKWKCFEKIKEFKAFVRAQLEHKIKVFRSDNGKKFTSTAFLQLLKNDGIEKRTSSLYMPQQNTMMEHANSTIMEMATSIHHTSTNYCE